MMNPRTFPIIQLLCICGCTPTPPRPATHPAPPETQRSSTGTDINTILLTLQRAPAWSQIPNGDDATATRLLSALQFVAAQDPDAVRAAVVQLLSDARRNDDPFRTHSKLFVLNRLMFAVPLVPVESSRWSRYRTDTLWPLHATADGFELTGRFHGYYGIPYNGLEEFDWFRQRFGLRAQKPATRPHVRASNVPSTSVAVTDPGDRIILRDLANGDPHPRAVRDVVLRIGRDRALTDDTGAEVPGIVIPERAEAFTISDDGTITALTDEHEVIVGQVLVVRSSDFERWLADPSAQNDGVGSLWKLSQRRNGLLTTTRP
jgi:hypothetical protein